MICPNQSNRGPLEKKKEKKEEEKYGPLPTADLSRPVEKRLLQYMEFKKVT